MPVISTEYIAIGCNRTTHAAAWGMNGLVAFGASQLIALYNPLDKTSQGILETLPGHTDRVICVDFIERGHEGDLHDVALVSGSADKTAKIWKKHNDMWVNSATLEGHQGAVEAIGCMRARSIAADQGDIIATGATDGTIRIWKRHIKSDTEDQLTLLQVLDSGNKYPTALALSYLPETTIPILACAHTDKKITIYIYQHDKFEKGHVLQGHDNWVRSLAFATYTGSQVNATATNHTLREGDLMLASGSQDRYIRLWKVSPHTPAAPAKSAPFKQDQQNDGLTDDLLQALQESALTGEAVELSTKAHLVEVKDSSDPSKKRQYSLMFEALLMGHDDWVYSVCWERPRMEKDANGAARYIQPMRLLSASSDKSMMIWSPDPATGVWVNEVRMGDIGGNNYLGFCGALFSPEGHHVLSHGANGSFHLWKDISSDPDDNRWAPEVSISGHFKAVESVKWDPKSRFLLSASLDQSTRLFAPWCREVDGQKVTTWHEMGRPQIHGYDLKCLSFIHDWQYVSGADEKVLRVFDAPKSCVASLAELTGEKNMAVETESRPVGANLPALGLSNKAVFEGDISEMTDAADEDHTAIQSYAHSSSTPTSLMEVMNHPPFEEHLLQHTLWPEVEKLYGHGYEIICVEATHDGKYIASGCKAATPEHAVVRLFDTSNWKESKTKIAAHTLTVTRARFSHNDDWLLTVSRDRFWSLSKRVQGDPETPYQLVAKNKAHARIIWDCSWSHDDTMFATGSRDKSIKIWTQQGETWGCVATIKCVEAVTAIEFAPAQVDGQYLLAVGLEDGQLQLLGAATAGEWGSWHNVDKRSCHVGVVRSLSWRTHDGAFQLASAGEDHSVRILNVKA
ncbi:WD40-repeat-containing domain protein [Zychaea mexicana]|uniref:WD40-repeat-containing domain protein n=1 Tax=Zychaea mexicana TaxID=64656 RepID=UPI0022FF1FC4|nr:WD40-repeat-containing domain protein [Zychaea mexicana]KAI9497334.1 WD40-repeat-containing domain protein [Zychaea mexicana]